MLFQIPGGAKMIGDFHIHSKHSSDSLMRPHSILKKAKSMGMDIVAITDHNSIRGGLEAQRYADEVAVTVIVGSEVKTDIGDIIGLNLERDISAHHWEAVIDEIRDQQGIVVLPHPYRGHTLIDEVASRVDFLEVWNSRCKSEQNQRAVDLAKSLKIKAIFGSDAHSYSEIGSVKAEIDPVTWTVSQVGESKLTPEWTKKKGQIIRHVRSNSLDKLLYEGVRYIQRKAFG